MDLKDFLGAFCTPSEKGSEVTRHLGFAGLAAMWMSGAMRLSWHCKNFES